MRFTGFSYSFSTQRTIYKWRCKLLANFIGFLHREQTYVLLLGEAAAFNLLNVYSATYEAIALRLDASVEFSAIVNPDPEVVVRPRKKLIS